MRNLPVLLAIMDGCGWDAPSEANAVTLAHTPHLDALMAAYPWTTLGASGPDVGLPEGQMGNSEVGHLNIGAGRVVAQDLLRIDAAIEDGSFQTNPVLLRAMDTAAATGATVHLLGLLSDGGVHSSASHGAALLDLAAARGVSRVRFHAFLDGRDVRPGTGLAFIEDLDAHCLRVSEQSSCDVRIGSVSGRYYAMDRDKRWDRVARAWNAIVLGDPADGMSAAQGVRASYDAGVTDEFVVPFACEHAGVADGDIVIFFNFRPDRARELSWALTDPEFLGFERPVFPAVQLICMTEYDPALRAEIAFPKEHPADVLADVIQDQGLRQLHTAETEKYAHVTFFLNGGIEAPKNREERVLIPSPHVATYDLQPEMSEPEVADRLCDAIRQQRADVYIVNFANPDMVGHTGNLEAAIKAVEATDEGVGRVVAAILEQGGTAIVTADHGNADCMFTRAADGTKVPVTSHTLARVPCIVVAPDVQLRSDGTGRLCDIAPTILDLVDITKPASWTGVSLLDHTETVVD